MDDNPKTTPTEYTTLEQIAKKSAINEEIRISRSALADELDISVQTAGQRLQELQDAGYIERQPDSEGQYVFLTDLGKEVFQEKEVKEKRIPEQGQTFELEGEVVQGMGEGQVFIELPGYKAQFNKKLGYEPFPGTLNLKLEPVSVRTRSHVESMDSIRIDGWSDDDRSFGPVYCYAGSVEADGQAYKPIHVIRPERTRHEDDVLEIISDVNLRSEIELEDGDTLTVNIPRM